ncbi:hypothetical protein F5887DRAFT_1083620 [Amanita rubescens]|nr:hypothetical protein F5887DRAFT_1083620 [Amanita rubescens]
MSSMYIMTHPSAISSLKMLFIIVWNVAGELVNPKNITSGSNNPRLLDSTYSQPSDRLNTRFRRFSLKKKYQAFRKELGETGQGLVEADHELEITVGTPLHNTWEKIKAKFKWYKRLHHLLSVNPVYDRPALANSSSSHDLQAVENVAKPMSASRHSPDWDDFGDDEDSVKSSPSPENSQALPAVLAPLHPPTPSASEPQKINPQKCKLSAFDHLKDFSERNQKTCISVAQIKAQTKLDKERRLQLEADREKREHEFRLEERHCQHELEMIKHTLEIEQLRAQANLGPGAPSNNPSPFPSIDPTLFR